MNSEKFQTKLQDFLAQPKFTDTMRTSKLEKQRSIVIGCAQFSDKLIYGFGHGLFVANGYPPLGMMFPKRFPEGRNAEGNLRMQEACGYLLNEVDGLIVPQLLWNNEQVLDKCYVQNALDATLCFSVSGMDYCLATLRDGTKIVGVGNWSYNGRSQRNTFILADADSCLLHFLKPEEITVVEKISRDNEGCPSDYSNYLLQEDGKLYRDEYLPASGGAGIFIS